MSSKISLIRARKNGIEAWRAVAGRSKDAGGYSGLLCELQCSFEERGSDAIHLLEVLQRIFHTLVRAALKSIKLSTVAKDERCGDFVAHVAKTAF